MSNWFQYDAVREAAREQAIRDESADYGAADRQERPMRQGRGVRGLLAALTRRETPDRGLPRRQQQALGEGSCD